ncbi:MAG: hypothetical protein ABI444_14555 [Candidatus Kapaibacterium sp.]|jgi:hypothetical protein
MSLVPFSSLGSGSRLWIFASDTPMSADVQEQFLATLDPILNDWQAHGAPLRSGRELSFGQFLFIAADPTEATASGCSIDSMMREVQRIGQQFGVSFLTTPKVHYNTAQGPVTVERNAFKELVQSGTVNAETIVFNNTLTTIEELRAGKWQVPARLSWHSTAFKLAP